MKVKFSNTDVDVWKLRKGTVLGAGSTFVYLDHFTVFTGKVEVRVEYPAKFFETYLSTSLEWLEPH